MNLSLHSLKKILPELNIRPLTEQDFWRICRLRNIEVVERRYTCKGYYVPDASGDYIFIDSRLKSFRWLEVALHELFHALLHYPSPFLAQKQQFQANAFTLMALMPITELDALAHLQDHPNRRARYLYRERMRLYFLYGV